MIWFAGGLRALNLVLHAFRGHPLDIWGGALFFFEKNNLSPKTAQKNNPSLTHMEKNNLSLAGQKIFWLRNPYLKYLQVHILCIWKWREFVTLITEGHIMNFVVYQVAFLSSLHIASLHREPDFHFTRPIYCICKINLNGSTFWAHVHLWKMCNSI